MKLKYYLFAFFCGLMCACSTPKDVVYFQGIDSLSTEQLAAMSQNYVTGITSDDLLSISVTAWDPASVTPFNPPVFAYAGEGEEAVMAAQSQYTYLVDREGYINFPVLGKIKVTGLTRLQLAEMMEDMISKYVENPLVNVQLLNFKVTVLGEVNRPGPFTIKNDRITILDVLGMAGDLPITANRKNVLIVRENAGQKDVIRMDLTDPALFASSGFYLKQNDVVYVEPVKNKQRTRTSSDRQFTMSLLTTIMTTVSIITSVIVAIAK